ncbi:MAG: hypothetical protein K2K53_00430 [Oscillospiraceae bacterium]|nr:hypothetical protein [Oscillospiraceae bacterium]
MTLLDFCKSFFPGEEIFVEHGETITVNTKKLLDLEQAAEDGGQIYYVHVRPSDILGEIAPGDWQHYDPRPGACCGRWDGTEQITLSKESVRIMKRFRLVIDPEVSGIDFDTRRPYFRVRGRPVTEEQAFEIIRRTDRSWKPWGLTYKKLKDEVWCNDILNNHWLRNIPSPQGWVRPSGQIGVNDCSGEKYPSERTFVWSILPLMIAFPYLDLMIGVTDWDEVPDYVWDAMGDENQDDESLIRQENYPDFEEHIIYGVWLHDGTMELMSPARAREKYAQYNTLYAGPDEEIYNVFYYGWENDRQIPVDLAYLKRCIRSHGLDPEEVLAGRKWGPKGFDLVMERREADAQREAAAPPSGT